MQCSLSSLLLQPSHGSSSMSPKMFAFWGHQDDSMIRLRYRSALGPRWVKSEILSLREGIPSPNEQVKWGLWGALARLPIALERA